MGKKYDDFLREGNLEAYFRDKVLKPGVVHKIHMAEDAENIIDFSNYYTKAEIDALFAALGVLATCLSSPDRHNFLMYDAVNECWKNQLLDIDFEDTIDFTVSNIWQALTALIRTEDTLAGAGLIIEDSI